MQNIDYTGQWPAKVKSWDLVEVEAISQLKLVVWFNVTGTNWTKTLKWEGFFLKKDGDYNKKTYKTLATLGFKSNDIGELVSNDRALNTEATVDVTVISEEVNGETYYRVDWVGGSETEGAVKEVSKLKSFNLAKLNAAFPKAKPAKVIKNYAPTAKSDKELDDFLDS